MISSRIVEFVESLSAKELDKLQLFLRSPYHNNGYNATKISELYDYLLAAYRRKELHLLDKKGLNERYFPEHSFQEKRKNPIDALSSQLVKKMKDFLFFELVQEDHFTTQQLFAVARFYRRNSYEERFWQVIKQFKKQHDQRIHRDAYFYLDSFLIESEVAAFRSIFNTYTDDANITRAHERLDQFYITQKLEISTSLAFQQKLGQVKDSTEIPLTQALKSFMEEDQRLQTPLAKFYKVILEWLEEAPADDALEAFADQLRDSREMIDVVKFRNLMAFYRYFLGMRYRKEVQGIELLRKIFDVYQEHLTEGYFLVEDKILPLSLNSIIAIATKLGEIKWAKKLLKDYPPERITGTRYPVEAHSLCTAEVLFCNQEYAAAHDHLTFYNFDNVNYSILADILLIKIYYATKDDLIYNRIRALEQKTRRSKLAERSKASYLNFLKFLHRVLKYEHDKTSKKWQKIKTDFYTIRPMLEREWLYSIL
ncbi:MAG: hypothetical protein AAFZ63_14935 [Bacteroidota bacterium]